MGIVYANSIDGDTSANISKNISQNAFSYQNIDERAFVQREIDNRFKDLPASQSVPGTINFLGSSYSGVDIKVVAHLYDYKNYSDAKLEELNRNKTISNLVRDGCANLLSAGITGLVTQNSGNLTFDDKKTRFLSAIGIKTIGEEGQEASTILLRSVLGSNAFSFLGAAKMRRAAEDLQNHHNALINSYSQTILELQKLGDVDTSSTITLATLQTLSVQSFREKNAVRALGHSYAKGYTRGARTIGGTMIFTIFDEHALASLIRAVGRSYNYGERDSDLSTLIPDQLPPLDLTIVFSNEYGSLSDFRLYGVEFTTDGSVFSIEDLLSEQTMNFVCRDADVMTKKGRISIDRLQRGMFNGKDDKDITGSSLLFSNDEYDNYLNRLGMKRRLVGR